MTHVNNIHHKLNMRMAYAENRISICVVIKTIKDEVASLKWTVETQLLEYKSFNVAYD